jgi:prepilin-type N-terminal cleavage/methylation domain-containing protein
MRRGLSLLELLVALAILLALVGLLLPAVQQTREAARRIQCSNKLRQIGLAIALYESATGAIPPGANGHGYSFHVTILPFMEFEPLHALFRDVDFSEDPANAHESLRTMPVGAYGCPSDYVTMQGGAQAGTSYAGNFGCGVQKYGYNGLFRHLRLAGPVTYAQVTDGLSQTVAVSEILIGDGSGHRLRHNFYTLLCDPSPEGLDVVATACQEGQWQSYNGQPLGITTRGRPWLHGEVSVTMYNHVLGPNQPSCFNGGLTQEGVYSAASLHPGGVLALYGDGHIDFVAQQIDLAVWRSLGSMNGMP